MFARKGWCLNGVQFIEVTKQEERLRLQGVEKTERGFSQPAETQSDWMETGQPFICTEW
ncbi:hypothetical protein AWB77_03902 [Caballeronia fortuita]|uniref:Uncharacterized protein n=1 Tax=Caballeronia fortuita TaxID=1777138 RepID=A0A158CBG7_9BURK|nr:hypothetical protein AWB77_03902 [Caballeronia fortuita]